MRSALLASTTFALAIAGLQAQTAPIPKASDLPVLLKVPPALLTIDRDSMLEVPTATATVAHDGSATASLSIEGRPDWNTRGLPSQLRFTLERVTATARFTELELRAGAALRVKLRFLPSVTDVTAAYRALVVSEPLTDDMVRRFRSEAFASIAPAAFGREPFASIPAADQRNYVDWALQQGAVNVSAATRGGRPYLRLDLGLTTSLYDPLGFSKGPLVTRALTGGMLSTLKAFSSLGPETGPVEGIVLSSRILHRAAIDGSWVADTFDLDVYAPTAQILRYAAGELSDREFIQGCTVLVNGTPTRVSLPTHTSPAVY